MAPSLSGSDGIVASTWRPTTRLEVRPSRFASCSVSTAEGDRVSDPGQRPVPDHLNRASLPCALPLLFLDLVLTSLCYNWVGET